MSTIIYHCPLCGTDIEEDDVDDGLDVEDHVDADEPCDDCLAKDEESEDEDSAAPHRLSIEEALEGSGYDDILSLAEDSLFDRIISVPALCSELCEVESDGTCPHGFPSVLRAAGMI